MRFRCPYCRGEFEELGARCPHCGRAMQIPAPLRPAPRRKKGVSRQRSTRQEEAPERLPAFLVRRSPSHIALALVVLLCVGAALVSQLKTPLQPEAQRGPQMTAAAELDALRIACEQFRAACGRYPSTREGLKALINNPGAAGWDGPYVNLIKPDPWRRHYVYEERDGVVDLFSCGPDGKAGTPDDLFPEDPASGILTDHGANDPGELQ